MNMLKSFSKRKLADGEMSEQDIKKMVADMDDTDDSGVSVYNNKIYFYSEVNKSSVLALNKAIRKLNSDLSNTEKELDVSGANIKLYINSPGGGVVDGLLAMDVIKQSVIPVYTIVDGDSSSAATLLSIVGKKRYMSENSFMLIHQLSTMFWGSYASLQDESANCKLLMEKLISIYKKHSKIPEKKLLKILKHDLYFEAKTCLKYGLVDEIL